MKRLILIFGLVFAFSTQILAHDIIENPPQNTTNSTQNSTQTPEIEVVIEYTDGLEAPLDWSKGSTLVMAISGTVAAIFLAASWKANNGCLGLTGWVFVGLSAIATLIRLGAGSAHVHFWRQA